MNMDFFKNRKFLLSLLVILLSAGLITALILGSEEKQDAVSVPEEAPGGLIINELMSKNRGCLRDEDGDFSDWIELKNISSAPIDLEGWAVSDSEEGSPWVLPQHILAPGECILLFASGKDRAASMHTDFSLSQGERLCLYTRGGALADFMDCADIDKDLSICRNSAGENVTTPYPTPGRDNTNEDFEIIQASDSRPGPLIVNEASVFDPAAGDWVEIKNISADSVSLSSYCLSDSLKNLRKLPLGEGLLSPGEIRLINLSSGLSLSSQSDNLYISDGQGRLSDWLSLKGIPCGGSYGRQAGENGGFYMASPSPGKENFPGFRRISAVPQLIRGGGISEGKDIIELSAPGSIYYSTDGSVPNLQSSLYEGPVELDKTGVLRAVAIEDGAMPSPVLDVSSIISEGHSLPVLSLVTDSRDAFDAVYANSAKGRELPASLSFFDGEDGFYMPCGVKLHGETSLVLPKKNMRVCFRGAYGAEQLSYDIYGGGVTEFTDLVLRAGQDFYGSVIRNELCQNLSLSFSDSLVSQRSRYCILYINGRYSGIYSIMERPNSGHYARLAGVSPDSVSVTEAEAPYDSELYSEVMDFCRTHDMSSPENYQELCRRLDVDSLIDWIIMEGFCENKDMTYGNLRYCRSDENDGKWRLMFYDLDDCFHDGQSCFYNVMSDYWLSERQVSEIIGPLMKNDEFRDRLLKRAAEAFEGPLSTESVIAEIDALACEIRPEIERDYARFGMTAEKWEGNIEYLKRFFTDDRWQNICINALCDIFHLSSGQRQEYFG